MHKSRYERGQARVLDSTCHGERQTMCGLMGLVSHLRRRNTIGRIRIQDYKIMHVVISYSIDTLHPPNLHR